MLTRETRSQEETPSFLENIYYYHNNHLGVAERMTSQAAEVVWSTDYVPFGGTAGIVSDNVTNNFRLPGQYSDLTGLYYNHHRYYVPDTGRYNRVDPLNSVHQYVYTNNPISKIDPLGLFAEPILRCRSDYYPKIYLPPTELLHLALEMFGVGTGTDLGLLIPIPYRPPKCYVRYIVSDKCGSDCIKLGGWQNFLYEEQPIADIIPLVAKEWMYTQCEMRKVEYAPSKLSCCNCKVRLKESYDCWNY